MGEASTLDPFNKPGEPSGSLGQPESEVNRRSLSSQPRPELEDEDDGEPDYDPSDKGEGYGDPQFPITHEIILKDHTKVVSALALDPSGARILSGSHDYDCKLWDFGGMDMRCKPFKSWEPAGTYYVRSCYLKSLRRSVLILLTDPRSEVLERRTKVPCNTWKLAGKIV